MRYVVVGLHAAGRSACAWLRKADPSAEIVGLDPSAGPLYARPLISYVLSGEMSPEAMIVAGRDHWAGLGVSVRGERAVSLDPGRARLVLESGREIGYDRLLLACGARPRPAGVGGPGAGDILFFRGRGDLEAILARVRPGGVAAVLGGGLVGFKLTMGLLKRGMSVRLIVASPRPLALNVDDHVGRWIGRRLAATPGVELLTSTSVATVEPGATRRHALNLDTGGRIEADLVVAGKGVLPAMAWLDGAGLDSDRGLLVDGTLRTSDERVYAAGDLAQAPDPTHGGRRVHAIWPAAVEQGRVAALNMAGVKTPYAGSIPQNAIPVFGSLLVSVGLVNPRQTEGCDEVEVLDSKRAYLKLVFRQDRLVGAVGLDAPPRLGELACAVKRGLARRDLPRTWLDNPKGAAPLAAPGPWLAGNARL